MILWNSRDPAINYLSLIKYRVRFFLLPKVLKVSDLQKLLVDDRESTTL